MFNQEVWNVFTPVWFRRMLKQIVTSKSGLQVAFRGLKLLIQRDAIAFYRHIFAKNQADLDYVEHNANDYREAGELCLSITASQLYYDTIMCLGHDPMLKVGFFANVSVAILIGRDSNDLWRKPMHREANRVQLPLLYAPHGDLLCAYVSPELVLETIHASKTLHNKAEELKSLADLTRKPDIGRVASS
jgi:hypothetical protein